MTSSTTAPPSAVRAVLASPLYRGATLAMFLSGMGISAATPQIASFLVNELGVGLSTAGLYYLTYLTAPIAGFLVGSRSDRTGNRLGLFRWCALASAVGWAAISFSTQAWQPFLISAFVLCFSAAAGSQLFAALHDDLRITGSQISDGVISVVRMSLTAGWILGPVVGQFLAVTTSARTMLLASALCTLAQIVPMGFRRDPEPVTATPSATAPATRHRHTVRQLAPLLTFTGLYVLVYSGETIKYGYLPLYMNDTMKLSAAVSGAVIGLQPLVELILMPVAVVVGRRSGIMRLMVIGAAFGVGANLCFALSNSAAGMFAGQALMGGVWGVFAGLGIVVAQRLLSDAVATASAVFMSSTSIASAIGGLAGSIGVGTIGLPLVFVVPAAMALIASVGLYAMSRSRHAVA